MRTAATAFTRTAAAAAILMGVYLALVAAVAQAQTGGPEDGGAAPTPTLITLKLDNVPPAQLFDELAKQASTTFPTLPPNLWQRAGGTALASPVSVAWDKQPFWLAMRDACAKTGISLKHATDTNKPTIILARDNQEWTAYPAVASGPFLVTLIGLHRSATVDMRKPSEIQRQFYAKFSIFCEPKVRLLRGSLEAKVESATDEKGNSLAGAVDPATAGTNLAFMTSWVHSLQAPLLYPKDAGAKVATLRCSAKFIAQVTSETIEITDPLNNKGASKSVAGRRVTIKELRRTPEEWEALVTLSRDQLKPEEWAKALFPGNALRLTDGDGKSIVARGFGLGGSEDEASFVFKFEKEPPKGSKIGKPVKLTWEIPTQTREIPLVWEFKDLPMP